MMGVLCMLGTLCVLGVLGMLCDMHAEHFMCSACSRGVADCPCGSGH